MAMQEGQGRQQPRHSEVGHDRPPPPPFGTGSDFAAFVTALGWVWTGLSLFGSFGLAAMVLGAQEAVARDSRSTFGPSPVDMMVAAYGWQVVAASVLQGVVIGLAVVMIGQTGQRVAKMTGD